MSTTCISCADAGRKGYCALGRCYCGHPACHAFDSWTELPALPDIDAPAATKPSRATTWDNREESTWIDRL